MFNEIMYNPGSGGQEPEYIGLFNTLCYDLDISGWELDGGIEYIFPDGTMIPAGGFLVVPDPRHRRPLACCA